MSNWLVRRSTRASVIGSTSLGVLVVVLAVLPFIAQVAALNSFIDLFVLVLLATTWNLLAGFGGMVSIGQQAYIGLGAYGLVVLSDQVGVSPFLALPLIALICGLVAIPVSFIAFRLVGGYFAVGTWVVAEVFRLVSVQIPGWGGGAGLSLHATLAIDPVFRVVLGYWLALACAVLVVAAAVVILRSRLGLALTAIRDEPVAASTSGINVTLAKRIVFVVAGASAGLGGGLLAFWNLNVQPGDIYSVQWSAYMIFMVVIGGAGSIEGPIIGAIVFWILEQLLAGYGSIYLIGLGVIGVLMVLFLPQGLWGAVTGRRSATLFPTAYRLRPVPRDSAAQAGRT